MKPIREMECHPATPFIVTCSGKTVKDSEEVNIYANLNLFMPSRFLADHPTVVKMLKGKDVYIADDTNGGDVPFMIAEVLVDAYSQAGNDESDDLPLKELFIVAATTIRGICEEVKIHGKILTDIPIEYIAEVFKFFQSRPGTLLKEKIDNPVHPLFGEGGILKLVKFNNN